MKKAYFIAAFLFFLVLISPNNVFAQSNYILPYPSLMPGSKLYKLQEIKDKLLQYWYFGNFGQFTYNLKQSDKYLVEAKTLFEYKQYLLGSEALQKSDIYFQKVPYYLKNAQNEGKDITDYRKTLKEASLKHIEILDSLKAVLPADLIWRPEKAAAVDINLQKNLDDSIITRMNI